MGDYVRIKSSLDRASEKVSQLSRKLLAMRNNMGGPQDLEMSFAHDVSEAAEKIASTFDQIAYVVCSRSRMSSGTNLPFIYFPYCENRQELLKRLRKWGLRQDCVDHVVGLLESVQPYTTGRRHLITMKKLSNLRHTKLETLGYRPPMYQLPTRMYPGASSITLRRLSLMRSTTTPHIHMFRAEILIDNGGDSQQVVYDWQNVESRIFLSDMDDDPLSVLIPSLSDAEKILAMSQEILTAPTTPS